MSKYQRQTKPLHLLIAHCLWLLEILKLFTVIPGKKTPQFNTAPFVVHAGYLLIQLVGQEREGESFNCGLPSWPWVSQPAMDDSSSLGKVSSSTESVATVTSEEFVLVQSSAAGSPQGSEGKPRLKVRTTNAHTITILWRNAIFIPQ